jgi:hypothetical protein
MKDLKEKVHEISEIAKSCPENLQQQCFEILLKHYLEGLRSTKQKAANTETTTEEKTHPADTARDLDSKGRQDDIKDSELHLKAKKFMKDYAVTIAEINGLFYKEGDKILALYDDLKTTKMSESQVRVALLQALSSAIQNGDFVVSIENVRAECEMRKCYDGTNFFKNFKNNAALFDEKTIDGKSKTLKVSASGKKKLGDLVKELQ